MTTGVILLAGGKARRFGADKRIARLPDGQWLIMAAIENIARSGLPLLVCLGADDAGLQRALRAGGIACIKCADSHLGMGSTLAEGIAAIDRSWRGVLVALADMPLILPETYARVRDKLAAGKIVVPVHAGRRGHPVGFDHTYFPGLLALRGDRGARAILTAHPDSVLALEVDDPGVLADVDRPHDLQALFRPRCPKRRSDQAP